MTFSHARIANVTDLPTPNAKLSVVEFARQVAAAKGAQGKYNSFMVMDIDRVGELIRVWEYCLPRIQPFFPVRCNNNPVLLKLLCAANVGLQCHTREELKKVLCYTNTENIIYSNMCWTQSTLQESKQLDVKMLSFRSVSELNRILTYNSKAELLLSVSADAIDSDDILATGCPVEEASELLQYAADMEANCVGIEWLSNESEDPSSIIKSVCALYSVGLRVGLPLRLISLGETLFPKDTAQLHQASLAINELLNCYFPREIYPQLTIIANTGGFFSSSAFSLVSNVLSRHSVDAGLLTMDEFDRGDEAFVYKISEGYYGAFGCMHNQNAECRPLHANETAEPVLGSIIGPTLDEFDVVQRICRIQPLLPGDWLIWDCMGTYVFNCNGNDEDTNHLEVFYFSTEAPSERSNIYEQVSTPQRRGRLVEKGGSCNGESPFTDDEDEVLVGDEEMESEWILGWLTTNDPNGD